MCLASLQTQKTQSSAVLCCADNAVASLLWCTCYMVRCCSGVLSCRSGWPSQRSRGRSSRAAAAAAGPAGRAGRLWCGLASSGCMLATSTSGPQQQTWGGTSSSLERCRWGSGRGCWVVVLGSTADSASMGLSSLAVSAGWGQHTGALCLLVPQGRMVAHLHCCPAAVCDVGCLPCASTKHVMLMLLLLL